MRQAIVRELRLGELSRETMNRFLAIAEMLRRRGEKHTSCGSRVPVLDATKMWTVPPEIDLSHWLELRFPRLSKVELRALSAYKSA